MKTAIILLAAIVISSNALAIDTKKKGTNMTPDSQTADSLLQEADSTFQNRDLRTAIGQYESALEEARREFNPSIEVEALSQLARMYLSLGEKEIGRPWLGQAAQKARESDPMGWSRYLGVKGRYEWKDSNLTEARATFGRLFDFCVSNLLWGRAVDAANMLAIVSDSAEDAIMWSRKGIEVAESSNTESWLGPLWNNLAGTYFEQKQFDSALECYIRARDYHWQFSHEAAKLFADYHVGMTLRWLGKYDKAASWLRPVLAWAERLENHGAIGQACEDLGELEVAQGQKSKGLDYLKRARNEYKLAGYDTSRSDIWTNINSRITALGG
ncbi:MAG: tetratricopeptide repeat protein [Candidatus Zixiibacteriota bacterium]